MVGGNFNTFGEPATKVDKMMEQNIITAQNSNEPLIDHIEKQFDVEGKDASTALPPMFDFDCYTANIEKDVKAP